MSARVLKSWSLAVLVCSLVGLYGCSGMEYVPGGQYFFYHKELPASKRAIEAARSAGKDKQCPEAFQAAEKLMKEAYALYYACHTQEAIAKANEAIAKANALCPPVEAPKPAPAPAGPLMVSFSASPASVEQGSCATLSWSTSNAKSVSIDEGVGTVEANGSKQVCPSSTTQYRLTAAGAGGSHVESTTVTVTARVAPAPIDRLTIHVNFDTNKYEIRKADLSDLEKAVEFVKKYPGCKVSVDGYTDSQGTEEYNQGLSERRAGAVKKYLLDHGATDADKITSRGFGESNPIADNATAKGRFENRRVEIVIVSR